MAFRRGRGVERKQKIASENPCETERGTRLDKRHRSYGGMASARPRMPATPAGFQGHAHRSDGWGGRIRTSEWRYQKPLPYHLATPQRAAPSRTGRRPAQPSRKPPFSPARNPTRRFPSQHANSLLRPAPALAISRPPVDRSVAQPGRAPRSGRGGRRFKSCHSDQNFPPNRKLPKAVPSGAPLCSSREPGES